MTQYYFIRFIITFLIGLALISCDKKKNNSVQPQTTSFEYPLKLGNSWNYHRIFIVEYFNVSDSLTIIDRDTIESDYIIQNDSLVILNGTIEVFRMKSTNLTSGTESLEYCNNNSQGLFCYAYIINDGAEPFAKVINNFSYKINFQRLFFNEFFNSSALNTDSLIFDNPPAKILPYPIVYNTNWTLRTNNQMTIFKKIIGNENIIINQESFNCYKIKYSYSNNIIANIDFVDYISAVGLVKRKSIIKNIVLNDINGLPTDMRCNTIEENKLISYTLN